MDKKEKLTLIYGIQAVKQAILSKKGVETVYLQKKTYSPSFIKLKSLVNRHKIFCQFVPKIKLDKLTGNASHQGIVAEMAVISYYTLDELIGKKPSLLLMLDRITDMRNFGSIVRTAECAGVNGIIIPQKKSAKISSVSMKTSAGALLHMPVCKVLNLKNAAKKLKNNKFQLVAASEKANISYTEVDFKMPTLLIVGSENKGINETLLRQVSHRVKIPMMGNIPSLNVSVATAVLLFEVLRQRQYQ